MRALAARCSCQRAQPEGPGWRLGALNHSDAGLRLLLRSARKLTPGATLQALFIRAHML